MSHEPYRGGRHDDLPPTRPMAVARPSAAASWIVLAVAVAALAIGYVYLVPDAPSPAMRADSPSAVSQPEK
jgi:hypothetical protein